ncbi:MAG: NADH-quinone oxidoreductase subunit C [Bryobacteraceae bacterium]
MLPDAPLPHPLLAALEAWDGHAFSRPAAAAGELLIWVEPARIADVCRYLRDEQGFERLSGLTAIDRYPLEPRFEAVYLLHSIARNIRLKLKVALPGADPALPSVTSVWEGSNWYEREAFDLFGIRFEGHPNLKRILLPEEWQGHPLRRDFPVHGHKYTYQNE